MSFDAMLPQGRRRRVEEERSHIPSTATLHVADEK